MPYNKKCLKLELHVNKRFSLVELLVVISIIAILAAMLLPTLQSAKGKAYDILCRSNLKQIGTALSGYTLSFADYLPSYQNSENRYWSGQIFSIDKIPTKDVSWKQDKWFTPYNSKLMDCPAYEVGTQVGTESMSLNQLGQLAEYTMPKVYGMLLKNISYTAGTIPELHQFHPKLTSIKRPSERMGVGESNKDCAMIDVKPNDYGNAAWFPHGNNPIVQDPTTPSKTPSYCRMNILFLDFHVDSVKAGETQILDVRRKICFLSWTTTDNQ